MAVRATTSTGSLLLKKVRGIYTGLAYSVTGMLPIHYLLVLEILGKGSGVNEPENLSAMLSKLAGEIVDVAILNNDPIESYRLPHDIRIRLLRMAEELLKESGEGEEQQTTETSAEEQEAMNVHEAGEGAEQEKEETEGEAIENVKTVEASEEKKKFFDIDIRLGTAIIDAVIRMSLGTNELYRVTKVLSEKIIPYSSLYSKLLKIPRGGELTLNIDGIRLRIVHEALPEIEDNNDLMNGLELVMRRVSAARIRTLPLAPVIYPLSLEDLGIDSGTDKIIVGTPLFYLTPLLKSQPYLWKHLYTLYINYSPFAIPVIVLDTVTVYDLIESGDPTRQKRDMRSIISSLRMSDLEEEL